MTMTPTTPADREAVLAAAKAYENPQMPDTERKLRRLLALRVAGAPLYMDDGELFDGSVHPGIDFLRHTPEQIESLLRRRAELDTAIKTIIDRPQPAASGVVTEAARPQDGPAVAAMGHAMVMIDHFIHGEEGQHALESAHSRLKAALATPPADAVRALKDLLQYAEAQICQHDETHRGGAIWEICDGCGQAWADDRGGRPEFEWPAEIEAARTTLESINPTSGGGDG